MAGLARRVTAPGGRCGLSARTPASAPGSGEPVETCWRGRRSSRHPGGDPGAERERHFPNSRAQTSPSPPLLVGEGPGSFMSSRRGHAEEMVCVDFITYKIGGFWCLPPIKEEGR